MCARASGLSTFSSPRLFRNHLRFAAFSPSCVCSLSFFLSLLLSPLPVSRLTGNVNAEHRRRCRRRRRYC